MPFLLATIMICCALPHTTSCTPVSNNATVSRDGHEPLPSKDNHPPSPCTTNLIDQVYGGSILDCSSRDIKSFYPSWLSINVTTLKLNNNKITAFPDDAFAIASRLRYLDFSNNLISHLNPNWFRGIPGLQVFLAFGNGIRLDAAHFTDNVFRFLPSLTTLDLGNNGNKHTVSGHYPEFLIKDLFYLESLVLDTFSSDLDFGSLFENHVASTTKFTAAPSPSTAAFTPPPITSATISTKAPPAAATTATLNDNSASPTTSILKFPASSNFSSSSSSSTATTTTITTTTTTIATNLRHLTLTGGMRGVRNDSFKSFYQIPLQTLQFVHLDEFLHTETNAFSPLKSLQNLFMVKVRQELNTTLLSLKPFVNRRLVNLYFRDIGLSFQSMSAFEGSKVMTQENGKYLRDICVEHLTIRSCRVLAISHDVLASPILAKCLKSFNAIENPLYGEINTYMELVKFKQLNSIALSNSKASIPIIPKCVSNPPSQAYLNGRVETQFQDKSKNNKSKSLKFKSNHDFNTSFTSLDYKKYSRDITHINCSSFVSLTLFSHQHPSSVDLMSFTGFRCYRISPGLESAFIVDMSHNLLVLNYIVAFWPNALKELYLSKNGINRMSGLVIGLNRLEILDVSHNDASELKPSFFDYFPSLKTLIVQNVNVDVRFIATSSSRLFINLTRLETLDLTDNGLNLLSPNTFETTKMKVLILAKNRFESIPFDLTSTPDLCLLNLSYNSISSLSHQEMDKLDQQATRKAGCFSLSLKGNILSCGCSQFNFIRWLQRTPVQLDSGGDYPCMDEFGSMSHTSKFRDLQSFWRQCNGKTSLLASIILFFFMCLGYAIAVLLYHFKTRLEAYVHQVILRKIKPKKPSDYPVGVYIDYSDRDSTFACLSLRKFVEDELGLTTFIRHRDVLPNQYRDASISQGVTQSWRVLLVVTDSFLVPESWSFYTMKLASSSVTATNQGKLVLLIQMGLEKKVPMCLLKAAKESSIIPLESSPTAPGWILNQLAKARLEKALCEESYADP